MGSNPGYLLKSFLLYTQQFKKIQFEFSRNHNLKKETPNNETEGG